MGAPWYRRMQVGSKKKTQTCHYHGTLISDLDYGLSMILLYAIILFNGVIVR